MKYDDAPDNLEKPPSIPNTPPMPRPPRMKDGIPMNPMKFEGDVPPPPRPGMMPFDPFGVFDNYDQPSVKKDQFQK